MRFRHLCAAMGITAGLAGTALAADPDAEAARLATLDGVFESTAPEPWYGGWGIRRFEFREGHWSLVFEHALDPGMTRKTFRFRTHGPYRIDGAVASAPGAYAAVFGYAAKFVTWLADDPALAIAFGVAGCGLPRGVEVDVSAQGCASWRPVADCAEDHDLLAFAERGLRFGKRPRSNDLCTAEKRPAVLFEPIVERR